LRTTSSARFSTNVKWDDHSDADVEEEHSEEEVSDMPKRAGLPHAQKAKFTPEAKKEPYPEAEEPEDMLTKEIEKLGRHKRGRGGLPEGLLTKHTKDKTK